MKNPLRKRVPKELAGDWRKYLVIILFMVFMIGVVSAMYVGNDSMMVAIRQGRDLYKVEDGRFELDQKAGKAFLHKLSNGKKADLKNFYLNKAYKKADRAVEKEVKKAVRKQVRDQIRAGVLAQCQMLGIRDEGMIQDQTDKALEENFVSAFEKALDSDEYKESLEKAKKKAHKKAKKKVLEKYQDLEEEYELTDPDFVPRRVKVYEHFYRNEKEDADGDGKAEATVRVYRSDSKIDQACFNEGRKPRTENEIAIDRMHAANLGLELDDQIWVGGKDFKIVGLLSYANYLTLHEKNTDLMFDAFGFDVAMVAPKAYQKLGANEHYNYAWLYEDAPKTDIEKGQWSQDFLKALLTRALTEDLKLKDYVPAYLNQAICFAPNDIQGDEQMGAVLVYILIAVIAFVFAVTISNTIDRESAVIGTLRALGYTRGELVRHYMAMPVIVTLIGALLGNVLGYTYFKNVVVAMYYNSYSLPTYTTVWNMDALVKTTLIPLTLMLIINLFVIMKSLQLPPLAFLRHDLSRKKKSRVHRLPAGWPFMTRFRLRVIGQNLPNYLILFFGLAFIEIMLCFAIGFPDSLANYSKKAPDMLFAKYQYMLLSNEDEDGDPVKTRTPGAEAFSSTSLLQKKEGDGAGIIQRNNAHDETVTIYGVSNKSSYVRLAKGLTKKQVYVSAAYADKYGLGEGDSLKLSEQYENKSYRFEVAGIFAYDGGVAVFMPNRNFNRVFDRKAGDFNGYFSNRKIRDIKDKYIANVLTKKDITKVTGQLQHSMGGFMDMFQYMLFILSVILIYLLTKIIIEKNENAISMAKILGFKDSEIGALYILSTAGLVLVFSLLGYIIGYKVIDEVFRIFMQTMDGWFTFYISRAGAARTILFILIGYGLVTIIDFIRIRRIPMDQALKNVE